MNEATLVAPDLFQQRAWKTANILGVNVHVLCVGDLLDYILQTIHLRQKAIVANVNVHALNLAYERPRFLNFLNDQAHVVFCDGVGVQLAAGILREEVPFRYTPPDWFPQLCQSSVEHDLSMYFLGAKPGVVEKAKARLLQQFPGLRIVGMHHGYFDKSAGSEQNEEVVRHINSLKPNILLVGFGMPLQEYWLMDNWQPLDVNVAIPVGALFDYVAGEVYRAPRWMTDNGLEWLGRLIVEPRRLWKRYLIGNPLFLWRVLKQCWGQLPAGNE